MASIKEGYNQFLDTEEGGRAYNEFKDVLYTPGDTLVKTLNNEVARHLLSKKQGKVKICDIGGGDGKRITHILSFLAQQYPDLEFELDFVEQSKYFCTEFEKRKAEIPEVEVTVYHNLFEDVVDRLVKRSYDIVFLIHSIFAFQDESIVAKIHSLVKREGKIVFISNAQDSFLAQLKQKLDQGYADKRTEIGDIKKALSAQGIKYSSFIFDTKFCISQEDIETSFYKILNWLSLGRYQRISSEKAKEIKNLLISLGEEKDGVLNFTEQEEVLIIPPVKQLVNAGS
ncbi:hypothetical protein [Porphyromonas loveana]|uniref:hypothetical protein n=1 Tax=Porphyromonas loveana TaxID=1884669 RepID=UPI0035A1810F